MKPDQQPLSNVMLFLLIIYAVCTNATQIFPPFGSKFSQVNPTLPAPPPYQTYFFDQYLDHFNFATQPATFKQRYLVADAYWGKPLDDQWRGRNPSSCPGPILFYTGNESPVTEYYEASGFFTQVLGPKFGALLIFAEHRYFGQSLPFGNNSFQFGNINFCSPDQALADYATLITDLKTTLPSAKDCPVIAFGGSYGGMLTTWFRLKYPHIVIGGLAASAPFSFLGTGVSPFAFADAATETFRQARDGCTDDIISVFKTLQVLAQTADGRAEFTQKFKLCGALESRDDAEAVIGWLEGGLSGMAMLDYPYPTNYGISLPGWPVNKTCDRLLDGSGDLLENFADAIGVFYNNTGSLQCYNISQDGPDWGTCCGWPYLACTEVYLPAGNRGIFPYSDWNLTADILSCQQQFGVTLRPYSGKIEFGGFDLQSASNIIFSNGLLDPWHTSGILESLSDSLVAVVIPAAAHHLDLRAPNEADPIYVQEARKIEEQIISGWISKYWDKFSDS